MLKYILVSKEDRVICLKQCNPQSCIKFKNNNNKEIRYHFQDKLERACEIIVCMYSCAILKIAQYFKTNIEIISDSKAKSFKKVSFQNY